MPRLSRCGPRRPPEPSHAGRGGRGDSLRSRFLRRLRAALLLALAQSFALPLALPASAQEVVEVPRGWPLKPSGLSATQTEFRLLFVTSTGRNAASSRIADYNRFVQGRAAAGHSSIRSFASKFRVVGSTGSVNARDNTSTTYTSSDKGPPIWWLNGAKAADHYEDFYDGSWDNENARNELGDAQRAGCFGGTRQTLWTGTNNNGTGDFGQELGGFSLSTRTGAPACSSGNPLYFGLSASVLSKRLYALSPVIKLIEEVAVQGVSIESSPTNATSGYAAGETIRIQLDFGEAVSVQGTPSVVLNIGGSGHRATYASGSGTRYLDFEYTVQAADFDSDGISLCSDTFLDRGCGRISLNGGSISAQSDSLAVELDLPALGNQSGHKVDATPVFVPNPGVGPMPSPSMGTVPRNWSLRPVDVDFGEQFRVLFVTSARDATSADINVYNQHAINDAGAGHSAIRAYKDGFRVIASTATVDARDNAGLIGTGVKIYWLDGQTKVADDYADLFDGSWDSVSPFDRAGNSSSRAVVWTGSTNAGVASGSRPLGSSADVVVGGTRYAPLSGGSAHRSSLVPLYALSQVLMVPAAPEFSATPGFVSQPGSGGSYRAGETIALQVPFTEPVRVLGAPSFGLTLGSAEVRARYVSGSGSDTLRFEYTVQRGDYDADGVSVELVDGESPFILDGAAIRAVADDEAVDLIADGTASVPAGAQHKVDGRVAQAVAASISSSPESGSTYGAGETITVRLAMNDDVLVTGRPHVLLNVGAARRQAVYVGPIGTATDVLEFSYVVQAGDFDADGVALCARGRGCGSIQLDGGSIRAAADEMDALLRHPALAAQAGHKVDAVEPLPVPPPACSAEIDVPSDWALKPSGVAAGGKFRLLFITLTRGNPLSSNIADYNSYVQARAANGHAVIRPYGAGFRAIGSTASVDARDNTCSTGTGVPIHWLSGSKVADDYSDFYDNSWDDETNRRYENGTLTIFPIDVWTGSNNDGTGADGDELGQTTVIRARFRGRGGAESGTLRDHPANGSINTSHYFGLSQVFVVDADRTTPATTDISIISNPAIGDAYRFGETVEVEVTWSEAVSVRGTPAVGLSVKHAIENYDIEYNAAYVRGSGTDKLVFAWTVPGGLKDDNGIQLYSDTLRLNGGTITAVSDGSSAAWTLADWRNIGGKVDSALTLSVGICERAPPVRDAIVAAVTAASDCSQVTEAHLAGMTGTLEVTGLTSIAAGDFAGLSGITGITLTGSGIETLPAGLFDGLGSLTSLRVQVGLTRLPKDYFRGLGGLTGLNLIGNRLAAGGLPDGIFEPLTKLNSIDLTGNPGSDSFRTTADAGPGGTLSAGQTVTLGGPGNAGGPWGSNVTYEWGQLDGSDNLASTVTLSATDAARPSFMVPALASATDVKLVLVVSGKGDGSLQYAANSLAEFTIRGLAPTGLAVVSKPVDGGETYRQGEKIEVAVTFGDRVLVDTSLGTPTLTLVVGAAGPLARYVRGSGTNRLVFAHTVVANDTDSDGISALADRLLPKGGVIASVYGAEAILTHTALAAQTGHKVDGSDDALTGGICERTPQLRDTLLELVRANESDNTLTCADVETTDLPTLTGTLNLGGFVADNRMTGLTAGDFAGLTGITYLALTNNRLRDIPAGVFDPLTALTTLNLNANGTAAGDGLTRLPAGLFDGLAGLTLLRLDQNDLSSLPPRIFEKLTNPNLDLTLALNPGSARFKPTAKAGPAGGFDVASGGSVTLEVEGPENDDLWGTNVTYAWAPPAGTTVTYTDGTTANSPRPTFDAPAADGTLTFTLTVTGGGGVAATSTVNVRVAAGPKVAAVAFASQPAGGDAYGRGDTIEVAVRFDRAVAVDTAGGTPSVALTVGGVRKEVPYRSGTRTRQLVFGYVVESTDADSDGVDLVANSLALKGGRIVAVSDGGAAALGHAALAGGNGQTVVVVDNQTPLTGGICGRTPEVRDKLVELVKAKHDTLTNCSLVDPVVHLPALTGTLNLDGIATGSRMTALKAGDLDNLTGVTALDLDNNALRSFPAGIFSEMTALTELSIAYNQTQASDSLMTLPAALFDKLVNLTTLRLEHNDLESLPDRIFEKLTNLTTLTLHGNPGSARFLPVAVAGPEGGIDAKAGEKKTLGGDAGGPWGDNVTYSWRKATGTTVDLSVTDIQEPTVTAPALAAAAALEYELTVTARGTSLTATDSVTVRVAVAAVVSSVTLVSKPVDGGDTYRQGEKIEAAVTFSKPVTVTGIPQLALSVGTQTRQATYVRGSGTNRLVFEYTVVVADTDGDGIAIMANRLALGGAMIVDANGALADLDHPALVAQTGHKVAGSGDPALTGGICERTPQLRDKLVELVRTAESNNALTCADVETTDLPTLTGTLNLGGFVADNRMTGLTAGDFAGLTGITYLALTNNLLRDIPAGVFDPLTALTTLNLNANGTAAGDGLTRLPAGLFDGLAGLTLLRLDQNDLSSLPPRIFEKLTNPNLDLTLALNPGSARFKPTAKAGPAGGFDVASGGSVTLEVEGPENDDLWGTNVTYAWAPPAGTTVTYTDGTTANSPRPTFDAPAADGTLTFTLTVTGGGGVAATSTVNVRVGATAMGPMPVSAVVDGETLTLTYDRDLQLTDSPPASAPGKGPVYLVVVSNIETAAPSAVEVTGRQVILTLKPEDAADFGETVTLSYYPDNAVAASKVRDLGDNLADAFVGLRVDNDTPEGNTVQSFAVTGPAKTYRIGDTIGIDVTFAEAVTVDVTGGAPTLALEIGAARRKAAYVGGSGSAVLTFEYTVAEGEEDTDGIAVEANGLEVPSGSSILNTEAHEAAILRHGRYHDPLHKVDGVLPAATAASAAGPTVMVTWSEALDEASVPTGAGGFRVRIGNVNGPAVSAVAVSGPTTTLSLASAIADGTPNVKLEYTPPLSGAKIRDAAGNDAAAIPSADALAVTVTPDTRAPEVSGRPTVDGTTLTVTFDEALDTASVPGAPGGFTVAVTRGGSAEPGYTVSGLSLSSNGRVVTLTLAQAVRGGDTVTLAYATPSTPLQDRAATPNEVADFTTGMNSVPAVTNNSTVNAAPTVATVIPDQTATAGTAFSYAFAATTFSDADGDTLTYTATQADGTALPSWLSFSASTRTFSGTPQAADVGTVSVKVTASDGSASVSDTFDIVVSAAGDNAPTVAAVIQDQTATAGTAFFYPFPATTFSDADGDTLTYTATQADGTALPSWLSFSASTRTFSGTPQAADVGTVSVKVTASDGSASVSDTFDIVVSVAVRGAPIGVVVDAPSGAVGLMRARWQAPPNASGIQGYHVRYRTVGTVLGASFRKVRANARELLLRYLEPGANYEAQICTVGSGERRGPCSPWARLQLAARNTVPANDFTVSLELPDGSAKATVAWDGTLTYRIRVRGVYDSSVLEFATSTVGTVATRLGPPGGRVPEFDSYDNNSDSTFSGYRGFARKFIVWDSPSSGYWERTQTVWTPAGANNAHVLELIDKPERLFTNRLNRIGTPSSLCVEITDSSNNVTAACSTEPAVGSPCGSLADELWCAEMTVGGQDNLNIVTGFRNNFYGSLVPESFNYGGPEYSIFEIRQDTVGRNLNFALRPVPSNSLVNTAGFHLHVGTSSYSFPADSTGPDTSFLVWTNIDDPGWSSIGDRVIVRLTGPPASANQVEGPTVEGAPAVSEAGADGHWTEGETVEVTLAFSEAVTVDTANGVPSVGLGLSGPAATRSAPYLRGSGTAELVFSYTLVAGDGDHTVMAVTPDSLALNGGAIRSVATSADAALGHNGALVSAGPPRAPEGPSARFEGVPANHDGSDAFTVELHFSAEPEGLSYRTVQNGLLKVDGGTVTRAARTTRGSNLGWRVTVAPSGTGDVQIQLPARPCGKPNAICIGNRPLRQAAQTTIPGIVVTVPLMPLTASFSGTPTEHDGTSPFELQLRLSEEPAGLSYRTVQSGLFDVSGGTIGRAWRLVRGNNAGWGLRIEPSGFGDVTLALRATTDCAGTPGVCTSDGRMLGGGLQATIAGPPTLAVADAEVDEASGVTLDFAVTLSRALTETVTVGYRTVDGSASAGADYTNTTGTLTFAAGETSKTVSVPVLDDEHDEGSETMTLRLRNPSPARVKLSDGEATGTINNTDAMPQAWLARFGRTVGDQAMEAVEARFGAARTPGLSGSIVGQQLSGISGAGAEDAEAAETDTREGLETLADWFSGKSGEDADTRAFGSRTLSGREVLTGSSFAFSGGTAERGFAAFWGRGAVTRFDGREGELTLDGEVASVMLGADFSRESVIAGLMVSQSRGEGGYRSPNGSGEFSSTLTALFPYGRYALSERVSVWGMAGYGEGTLTLTPEGQVPMRPDMDLMMGALGVRGVLLDGGTGGPTLAATFDAFAVRTSTDAVTGLAASEADVTRVRLALEGSQPVRLGGDAVLTPSLEFGLRHDGGDAETGFGADFGAGLALTAPSRGLSAEIRARGLLTHEADGMREWGVSGTLAWDPAPDSDRGLSLSLSQTVGAQASGGADALLARPTLAGLGTEEDEGPLGRRLDARLGYGLGVFDDRWTATPELGLGLSDTDRELRLGWRLTERVAAGLAFELGVEGTRRESVDGAAGPEYGLEVGLGWRLVGARASHAAFEMRIEAARRDVANDDRAPEDTIWFKAIARW